MKTKMEEKKEELSVWWFMGEKKYDDFDQIGTLYTGWVRRLLIYGHIQHNYLDSCNI